MLVLSRKVNETICIGDNIRITLLNSSSGRARFGIEAPKGVPVHREEVKDRIDRESPRRGNVQTDTDPTPPSSSTG
jgi:carbon storage regulator